jgi:hypothetical protein
MIQRFNQVYIHFLPSFVETLIIIYYSSFFCRPKTKSPVH